MTLKSEFKKKVVLPYQKRKKIIHSIDKKYIFLVLLVLIIFLFNKKHFLFVILTGLSAVFSFYHSKFNRTPLDFKLSLFLGLFITRYYGILFTVIFFIISDIIPALLGGESVHGPDLFFFAWFFIVNSAVYLFPNTSLVILGPIFVLVHDIGAVFINMFFGMSGIVSLLVSALTILVRIIYFLTLGVAVEGLFTIIQ